MASGEFGNIESLLEKLLREVADLKRKLDAIESKINQIPTSR